MSWSISVFGVCAVKTVGWFAEWAVCKDFIHSTLGTVREKSFLKLSPLCCFLVASKTVRGEEMLNDLRSDKTVC